MFIRLFELAIVAFMLWLLANVIRAIVFKSARGGGFWGLYNYMTKEDRERIAREAVQAKVEEILAAERAKRSVAVPGEGGHVK